MLRLGELVEEQVFKPRDALDGQRRTYTSMAQFGEGAATLKKLARRV